jgi:hypothetical protein
MRLIQFTSDRYVSSLSEKMMHSQRHRLSILIQCFFPCLHTQAHSIQELARKKFQELRDEGIPTENQVKSEQKVKPIPSNRGPVKKPVLTYSDDDLDFLIRKEQIKRPIAKISGDDMSFKDQVKKPVSRNSENLSSFHKERVTKPIFRNSENDLSSSFHKEHVKKPLSRNSEDDRSSSFRQVKVRKAISRNS